MGYNQHLTQAYQAACLAEIQALKPGNVHIFADGHGMVVQDFIKSAGASAVVIAQSNLCLGERIYRAVEATWVAVGCNTNLGIILLCAPIIQAALNQETQSDKKETLSKKLSSVLSSTTIADAQWVFDAIKLASPAGLGARDAHDVNQPAVCTLLEAMQTASEQDLIAQQYSNDFDDLLNTGLLRYRAALQRWQNPAWAATALHLHWMAHYPDSHIARKHGLNVAETLQEETLKHEVAFLKQTNPKHYQSALLKFDLDLKSRGLNPGTSADLTVATLLLDALVR